MTPREANYNSHSQSLLSNLQGQPSIVAFPTQELFVAEHNALQNGTSPSFAGITCIPNDCNRARAA